MAVKLLLQFFVVGFEFCLFGGLVVVWGFFLVASMMQSCLKMISF